jgi:hypothetical protein
MFDVPAGFEPALGRVEAVAHLVAPHARAVAPNALHRLGGEHQFD